MIARGLAIGLLLLCGACHRAGHKATHAAEDNSAGPALADDNGSFAPEGGPKQLTGSLFVTPEGLEVADARGVTTKVPFGTDMVAVDKAIAPAAGVADKAVSIPCGDRKVTEQDFPSVTLSFENGKLVSWRAFGTTRMPSGIGEGTPRDQLAAAYPDLHPVARRQLVDSAQAFAAGPIRGYLREGMVTAIDGGKPMCAE